MFPLPIPQEQKKHTSGTAKTWTLDSRCLEKKKKLCLFTVTTEAVEVPKSVWEVMEEIGEAYFHIFISKLEAWYMKIQHSGGVLQPRPCPLIV